MLSLTIMRSLVSTAAWAMALSAVFAFVTPTFAQDITAAPAQGSPAQDPAPQSSADDFPDAVSLSESDLDTLRGGQGVEITSSQNLTAQSVGNSVNANEVGSGSIALEGDAFSSFNGVANVVVNTGHNNNLQGSVSVNVIYNEPVPASTP
jgi:hypothetical protein